MDYKKLFTHIGLLGGCLFAFVCVIAFCALNTFSWEQTGIFAITLAVAFPIFYVVLGTGRPKSRAQIALAGITLLAELLIVGAGAYYLFSYIIE